MGWIDRYILLYCRTRERGRKEGSGRQLVLVLVEARTVRVGLELVTVGTPNFVGVFV